MEWELWYPSRPWTVNAERTWHYHKRAAIVREWREAFCLLAKAARIPQLRAFQVIATPYFGDGRIQDVGAAILSVKAAIDGLIDAGVAIDDRPKYLKEIRLRAPVIKKGVTGLSLVVQAVEL